MTSKDFLMYKYRDPEQILWLLIIIIIRDSEHSALNGIPPSKFFPWGSGSPVVEEVKRVQEPAWMEDAKVQHHLNQHDGCTGELTETDAAFTKKAHLSRPEGLWELKGEVDTYPPSLIQNSPLIDNPLQMKIFFSLK